MRVVVLTATLDEQLVRDTLAAGASGFLLKDVTRRGLVTALQGALSGEVVLHPEARRLLGDAGRRGGAADAADAGEPAEEDAAAGPGRRPRAADLFA